MENRHENPDSTLVPAVLVLEGGADAYHSHDKTTDQRQKDRRMDGL